MRLALLIMALLTPGCATERVKPNPHHHGWTSPNMAREGREAPALIEVRCAGCSQPW